MGKINWGKVAPRTRPSGVLGPALRPEALRDEDEHRALASGFQRHLAKPVDSHTLVRSIADVLAAHRREMAS